MRKKAQMREAMVLTTPKRPVVSRLVLPPLIPTDLREDRSIQSKNRGKKKNGDALENGRGVVVDGVYPRTVLVNEERGGDEETTSEEPVAEKVADRGEDTSADGGAVVLDCVTGRRQRRVVEGRGEAMFRGEESVARKGKEMKGKEKKGKVRRFAREKGGTHSASRCR